MFKESTELDEFSDLICLIKRREKFNIRVSPSLNNNHSLIIENKENGNYCRLSIFSPEYRNLDGENYTLSEEELQDLVVALNENDQESWKLVLGEINDELEDYDGIVKLNEDHFDIPNYMNLKGETNYDKSISK